MQASQPQVYSEIFNQWWGGKTTTELARSFHYTAHHIDRILRIEIIRRNLPRFVLVRHMRKAFGNHTAPPRNKSELRTSMIEYIYKEYELYD